MSFCKSIFILNYSIKILPLSFQIKKRQMHIRSMLEAQKIPFEVVDVAQDQEALGKMRRLVDDEEALPPQIMNGDVYCGVSIDL